MKQRRPRRGPPTNQLQHAKPVSANSTTLIAEAFQGPIPPPEVLREFGAVDPTFPERIVRLWEEQATHRRDMEARQVKLAVGSRLLGLVLAALCVLAVLALAAYGFMLGAAVPAAAMVGSVVVGLVWAFQGAVRSSRPSSR